jgi:hypothetical protein
MWTYEYEELGGYDCMTGAFVIKFDGHEIATIDQNDFGQTHCEYYRMPDAEAKAQFIVDACNLKMQQTGKCDLDDHTHLDVLNLCCEICQCGALCANDECKCTCH